MAAHGFAFFAGLLFAFPTHGDWEPPKTAPAHARALPGFGRDSGEIGQLMSEVRTGIERGRRSGQLSRGDAKALRREAEAIGALEARYAEDGLSDSEEMALRDRLEALRSITDAAGLHTPSR